MAASTRLRPPPQPQVHRVARRENEEARPRLRSVPAVGSNSARCPLRSTRIAPPRTRCGLLQHPLVPRRRPRSGLTLALRCRALRDRLPDTKAKKGVWISYPSWRPPLRPWPGRRHASGPAGYIETARPAVANVNFQRAPPPATGVLYELLCTHRPDRRRALPRTAGIRGRSRSGPAAAADGDAGGGRHVGGAPRGHERAFSCRCRAPDRFRLRAAGRPRRQARALEHDRPARSRA